MPFVHIHFICTYSSVDVDIFDCRPQSRIKITLFSTKIPIKCMGSKFEGRGSANFKNNFYLITYTPKPSSIKILRSKFGKKNEITNIFTLFTFLNFKIIYIHMILLDEQIIECNQ